MKMKFAFCAACAISTVLAACAATPVANSPQVAEATQTCRQETTLGSTIAHRSCSAPMTQEERDAVARDITLRGQPAPLIKNN
jgi:hypothetical protein